MHRGERFNSISHLIGSAAALAGTACLMVIAVRQGDPWKEISFGIYGASLVLLYGFSTLYHSLSGRGKAVFRTLDHLAIYLLIAGTYTPFTLITLRGPWGWSIFGIVWGLAVFGMILDTMGTRGPRIVPIVIYLLMGWLVVVALKPLMARLPLSAELWLLTGGLFYTTGIVFYALDKRVRHFHGIWHLFVMAGSLCHYITILNYVART